MLDTQLLQALDRWHAQPDGVIEDGRSYFEEIKAVLEWFICDCLQYATDKRMLWWWSDGVIDLEVSVTDSSLFRLTGVTWIDCKGLAPFDIELRVNAVPREIAKCIFRIGNIDEHGAPQLCPEAWPPCRVKSKRPHHNPEWAMAIELSPPATT